MVRLFNTTETDDKAIAAAHTAGLNIIPNAGYSIPAATVIPMVLYMKAQNRFCFMVSTTFLESTKALLMQFRSLFIIMTCAAFFAASVPSPMAILTSAFTRAAESFIRHALLVLALLLFYIYLLEMPTK